MATLISSPYRTKRLLGIGAHWDRHQRAVLAGAKNQD